MLGYSSTYSISIVLVTFCFCYIATVVGAIVKTGVSTALRKRAANEAEAKRLVQASVEGITNFRHPCVFVNLEKFVEQGKFIPHEEMRDAGMLKTIDTFEKLLEFTQDNPTLFASHQWLGNHTPDPDGIQFKALVNAAASLCAQEKIAMSAIYIWVDYSYGLLGSNPRSAAIPAAD